MLCKLEINKVGVEIAVRTININQLQAQISRIMKNVEEGESYEVMRYSRPIAIITPKKEQIAAPGCEECIRKIDELAEKFNHISE